MNEKVGGDNEDQGSDLRTSKRCWHHNRNKVIVDDDDVVFVRVSLFEIGDEADDSGHEDGEARDSDGRLRREVEHSHDDWDGDTSAPNASDVAQSLDGREDDEAANLQREHWENRLVPTETFLVRATNVPRVVETIFIHSARDL